MVEYMRKIGDKTFELAKEKLADIFPQFHSHINNPCPELTLDSDDDDDSQLNMYMDDEELQSHIKSMKEKIKSSRTTSTPTGAEPSFWDLILRNMI